MGSKNSSNVKEGGAASSNNYVVPVPARSEGYKANPPQANFSDGETRLKQEDVLTTDTPDEKYKKYRAFRDELLGFRLGEAAYDYADRMFRENPDSPAVMALLAETAARYDGTKNKHMRGHWVDRLDLLQHGIDVSRKCIKENPDFFPCYRAYVTCAVRASESLYYYRWMRAVGLLENYGPIVKRGEQGLALEPKDVELNMALGLLHCRCVYDWYSPYRILGKMYGVPSKKALQAKGIAHLKIAAEGAPHDVEIACRLGMSYFHAGDHPNARRWLCKVRDELVPQSTSDEKWQGMAHTTLSTGFIKPKWNVPFA